MRVFSTSSGRPSVRDRRTLSSESLVRAVARAQATARASGNSAETVSMQAVFSEMDNAEVDASLAVNAPALIKCMREGGMLHAGCLVGNLGEAAAGDETFAMGGRMSYEYAPGGRVGDDVPQFAMHSGMRVAMDRDGNMTMLCEAEPMLASVGAPGWELEAARVQRPSAPIESRAAREPPRKALPTESRAARAPPRKKLPEKSGVRALFAR